MNRRQADALSITSKARAPGIAEAALAGNTLVWGATFVLVKSALADASPLMFLALRFTLASGALLALFHRSISGRDRSAGTARKLAQLRGGVLAGFFLFLGYFLQTLGLQFTTAPKSAFITGLTSVIVPLLAALVYQTRPQASELLGVVIATAGLGLMTSEGKLHLQSWTSINRGDLLTAGCSAGFAAHIVTVGHCSRRMSFEFLSIVQVTTVGVLSGAFCWWTEPPRLVWQPTLIFAIIITGLLATALAFTIQTWAQRQTTATRTALIYMLEPVFAWLTSYLVVGEGLSRRAAAGATLIVGGILLAELKPLNLRLHLAK